MLEGFETNVPAEADRIRGDSAMFSRAVAVCVLPGNCEAVMIVLACSRWFCYVPLLEFG